MNIDKFLDNRVDTANGYCYKNEDAFEHDLNAICYIGEHDCYELEDARDASSDFSDEELKEHDVAYSRTTLRQVIADFYEISVDDVIANNMDAKVFGAIDWQCPETYLNEVDVEELYD